MNTSRRRLLQLAALSTTAWTLTSRSAGAVTERSGSRDRQVTHKTAGNDALSCDNAAVPVSERSNRLASIADFGGSQQAAESVEQLEGAEGSNRAHRCLDLPLATLSTNRF